MRKFGFKYAVTVGGIERRWGFFMGMLGEFEGLGDIVWRV
jgi:hypothetical protein